MIISEVHILQEELNNLERNLLACAYPLHLIIKKTIKPFIHTRNNLYLNRHHVKKQSFFASSLPSQT